MCIRDRDIDSFDDKVLEKFIYLWKTEGRNLLLRNNWLHSIHFPFQVRFYIVKIFYDCAPLGEKSPAATGAMQQPVVQTDMLLSLCSSLETVLLPANNWPWFPMPLLFTLQVWHFCVLYFVSYLYLAGVFLFWTFSIRLFLWKLEIY